jgi:hypothetical protein
LRTTHAFWLRIGVPRDPVTSEALPLSATMPKRGQSNVLVSGICAWGPIGCGAPARAPG